MNRLLEIRTYRLKPGTLHAFHAAMHQHAVPMIRASGMDVVCYGHSDHEEESYCLVRAYADRQSLETEQAAFYNSKEWREGPRQALVVHIETYLNTLLWMADDAVESLRTLNPS
ncbi:NIPSNAP family protein [Burkholderia pyrrocinia]|uniref:NIPSNAP family protein n=1 Tax=Burkholderia pyrrocinia TaxID=60550 RepID=UPI0015774A18|nr:NIPSNAP family protein [Burkholderia pyrrocinia]NTX25911.1 NIPSNAP family protein [Burkholderia pyrrocinia]QVN20018.1 NIPSNAP family protein [Burkholderia pyrrocinia]